MNNLFKICSSGDELNDPFIREVLLEVLFFNFS